MTRYLFGIFAVALAFAAISFKAPGKKQTGNLYIFTGTVTNETQVKSQSYWNHVPSGNQECLTNADFKACEIITSAAPAAGKLPSSVTITTGKAGSTYYVSAVSSGMAYNRP